MAFRITTRFISRHCAVIPSKMCRYSMKHTNTEVFLKIYVLNEAYHEKKERMAWVASTVYYTFALAVVTWLFSNPPQPANAPLLTAFVSVVFVSALSFTTLQFSSR